MIQTKLQVHIMSIHTNAIQRLLKTCFLKLFIKISTKERKIKPLHKTFCTSLLKIELHLISQGNLSLTLHYFKRFTQFTKITLSRYTKQHQDS